MVAAIDQCYRVDEVKDLRDQAMALEHYARQAQNVEAERKAIEVRIRAERRAGELLKETERGNAGRPEKNSVHAEPNFSQYQESKREANISDTQAKRWQKLAEIPHVDFERKLHDPLTKPTTTGLLHKNGEARQAPDDALWLWGQLRDFERKSCFEGDINYVVSQMSHALQSDVRRIVPQLMEWLGELEGTF
jgi:hypothetical protein